MAKFTIGGVEYDVPPLRFKALKQAAVHLDAFMGKAEEASAMSAVNMMAVDAILHVVEIGLQQKHRDAVRHAKANGIGLNTLVVPPSFDDLEDALTVREQDMLHDPVFTLMEESELITTGERPALAEGAAGSPSPEPLSTELSPSSSPQDAREGAGS